MVTTLNACWEPLEDKMTLERMLECAVEQEPNLALEKSNERHCQNHCVNMFWGSTMLLYDHRLLHSSSVDLLQCYPYYIDIVILQT